MRKVIYMLIVLNYSLVIFAQKEDTIAFVKSKRMSEADLAKKKEGRFWVGIPDISSDPVTGFGFGVRTNMYWNGFKENPFFAYTPYLMKLKVNAAYYTSNAKELKISLDVPYYKGSRWRFKIDLKAQQNPTNLYFGLTEFTLQPLRLPSTPQGGPTFATYAAFDNARKTLRAGGAGEAAMVTDALSNRFRESELMFNIKADYALGKGDWRVLGGYEIQSLKYKTFEGMEADAIDPITGQKSKAPNGISLLRRESDDDLIKGIDGGRISLIQSAIIFDTRDFEPDPSRGYYVELGNEFSNKIIGSQHNFDKLFLQARAFKQLPFGSRTVLAGRLGVGNIFGKNAPFFEFQDQWSPEGSINALGGKMSLRGFRDNRFLARSMWFSNVELRVRLAETKLGKQNFTFGVAPFYDFGTVSDRWQNLSFTNIKSSYGAGARIGWNQSTILFFDFGKSKEDSLFYFGIGQIF